HLEAEGVDVELPSGVDVAHLQVHVAHDAGVDAGIGGDGLGEVLGEVGVRVDVQRVDGHLAARPLAGLARPVPVQLDAVALGVGEVERLGHQVVAGAGEAGAGIPGAAHHGADEGRQGRATG